jgi:uncharacterized protein (UPF0332 family)
MSHAKNKVEWCLNKAKKELEKEGKHRGLIKTTSNIEEARRHISKAEHYFKATDYLKRGNYSDISTSTLFYCIYHCFLAIAQKFGYESRNQECTFALIRSLIEDNKIDLTLDLLDKISSFNIEEKAEQTSVEIREQFQYGTSTEVENKTYDELLSLARKVLSKTKEIIEK